MVIRGGSGFAAIAFSLSKLGVNMVSNKLVVSGYNDGVLLIELTYNGLLDFEQIDKICETLRQPLNEMGERVTFNISIIDDNF